MHKDVFLFTGLNSIFSFHVTAASAQDSMIWRTNIDFYQDDNCLSLLLSNVADVDLHAGKRRKEGLEANMDDLKTIFVSANNFQQDTS